MQQRTAAKNEKGNLDRGSISSHFGYIMEGTDAHVPLVFEGDNDGVADSQLVVGMEEREAVECDVEFTPIEHPMEPLEEDRPAKCPMPDSSLFREKKAMLKEAPAEEFQNMVEPLMENEESFPTQADRKRHHRNDQDSSSQPAFRTLQYNIFQVFQQCKEFSS
ncbi:hypothetical protein AXF42_Ash018835 [Apostasia shenzhenica]|uniref:Uncharacterized protein n=1 Tax=Apostasia shenzhenica TaxID=1088818 RepID=A0A2I0B171_9ASPA|nr:hypothetical protein AXF42_Ash018835 [Apostasia shenzhenica]